MGLPFMCGGRWIPRPWSFKLISPCSMQPNMKVSELLQSPGVWNYDLIQALFLPQDVDSIMSIPLVAGMGGDTAIWHYRKDGKYSVRSGYQLTMDLHKAASSTGGECSNGSDCGNSVWSKNLEVKRC